jgi:uncharacterized protein YkwD
MTSLSLRGPAALSILLLVVACGGGGDAPSPSPSPSPSPAPAPGPAPSAVRSTCGLPDFQAALLARINQLRASGTTCGGTAYPATGTVAWNGLLTQAADGHALDMSAQNYMSHTSLDGRTLRNRIDATGYAWSWIGENIAGGYPSVDAVMNGWIASAGHCANLMNPNFSEVGVACVPGTSSTVYSHYWAMNLGAPP